MTLEATITQDLKTAMLARDEQLVSTLRLIKSAVLYLKVDKGSRDSELSDADLQALLAKEAKKHQESADLYVKGGNQAAADKELAEKAMIEKYLPKQLDEDEIRAMVGAAADELGVTQPSDMGRLIGVVKAKAGAAGDGALIARLAKERLSQ